MPDTLTPAETCEHGIAMDAPCGPCAVAGHEPVDVEPAPLTDCERHLADCRACALQLPDGHAYESLIDVRITVEELATLATREDVDVVIRGGARDALLIDLADAGGRAEPSADDYAEAARILREHHQRRPLPRA